MRRAAAVAGTTVLVVLAVVLLAVAAAPRFGVRATVLTSGSMSPTVPAGGMIAVRDVDPEVVAVGDVLTYRGHGERGLVTHRVIRVHDVQGRPHFVTQGDANAVRDPHSVSPEQVVGVMVADLTPLAPLLTWVVGSRARALLPGLAALLIIVGEVRELRRAVRTDAPGGQQTEGGGTAVPVVEADGHLPHVSSTRTDAEQPPDSGSGSTRVTARAKAGLPWRASTMAVVALVLAVASTGVGTSVALLRDDLSVATEPVTSTSVLPPNSVAATFDCGIAGIGREVLVTWTTATTGTHEVRRRTSGTGPWTTLGTTTVDELADMSVALGTTYDYVVVTTVGPWSSAPSAVATVTTPPICLV